MNIRRAQKTWERKKATSAKEHLDGKEATAKVWKHTDESYNTDVGAGSWTFHVTKRLGLALRDSDKVTLQYHLVSIPYPYPYVASALPTDLCSRLGVSIRGNDSLGNFYCWLAT